MSDKFTFGYYLNNRAFIEHSRKAKLNKKLDDRHQTILSLIIHIYENYKKIETHKEKNELFKYMSDKLILNQNPLLKIKSRQLKNYIRTLIEYKYIKVSIRENNKRFICIDNDYMDLMRNENWEITPVNFLRRYKPHLYKSIEIEYKPQLKDFDYSIECFNTANVLNGNGKKYTISNIYSTLTAYLTQCVHNDYSRFRGNSKAM
jgi:hypothetical protein